MVLRDKYRPAQPSTSAMASDQPVKKKQRIDAPDLTPEPQQTYDAALFPNETISNASPDSGTLSEDTTDCAAPVLHHLLHFSGEGATASGNGGNPGCNQIQAFNYSLIPAVDPFPASGTEESNSESIISHFGAFQEHLIKQCLCGLSENMLRRPFTCRINISEWPPDQILVFLSNLQLLFDVYLKQNYKGSICTRLMFVCDALVRNEHDWIGEIITLADHPSKFVHFVAARVVSSFLIVAKDSIDHNLLSKIIENVYLFDTIDNITVRKINFSLDVIKKVVEWKDVDQHPLEDSAYINSANPVSAVPQISSNSSNASTSSSGYNMLQDALPHLHMNPQHDTQTDTHFKTITPQSPPVVKMSTSQPAMEYASEQPVGRDRVTITSEGADFCVKASITDSESFDTSHIKCLMINCLQQQWPRLINNIQLLLTEYLSISSSENCVLTFLLLWENIISVKANLSVVDTKPFYKDLESFVEYIRSTDLPPLIYMQFLSLFNEVLCYGSTLALQDILPEEICTLAHNIVRYVKDFRLLNDIRLRHSQTGFGFISFDSALITSYNIDQQFMDYSTSSGLVDPAYGESELTSRTRSRHAVNSEIDKTMLQKMVLLVLKSVAVTVKGISCDSSDSSIDSSDYGAIQDMQMVERSIRDVLKKLDVFLKNALDFLPESQFTKILIHLFSEQDDYLIESMVCTLDITVGIVYRNSVFPDLIPMLNPILTFIEFLEVVSHDSDVLLDYLISNETCFLLYLLRFLKYVKRNWAQFVNSCRDEQNTSMSRGLDETMSVLRRLRMQINRLVTRSLFPYNIDPVLRLLKTCENLYDGNELS